MKAQVYLITVFSQINGDRNE